MAKWSLTHSLSYPQSRDAIASKKLSLEWFWKAFLRNYLYFCSNVVDNGDYCKTTAAGAFLLDTWYKIEIEQKFEAYQVFIEI